MRQLHDLKTWPEMFAAVASGEKTAEIRRNDRNFAVGDWLDLGEFDPETRVYTGRSLLVEVTHILRLADWVPGADPAFVMLSFRPAGHGDAP
jgi:hypothetical protein